MKWIRMTSQILAMMGGLILLVFLMPQQSGWQALNVATGSMSPAIKPGSLVIIHEVPQAALKVGDVVTYMAPMGGGQTITHRIADIQNRNGARRIVTKGDANDSADRPIATGRVVGRVALVIPGLGGLANSLRTPELALVVVILPGLWVIIAEFRTLWRIWQEPEDNDDDKPAPPKRPLRTHNDLIRLGAMTIAGGTILGLSSTQAALHDQAGMKSNSVQTTAIAKPKPTVTPKPSPSASPLPSPTATSAPAATLAPEKKDPMVQSRN